MQTEQAKIEKLRELIKDIDIAMLTTVDEDGSLRSRPMGTQEAEFDGDLWFFTSLTTGTAIEIQLDKRVNVSYASGHDRFVSVSGTAMLVNDRAKMQQLWSPIYKAYFPGGLDDLNLRLIKVDVHKAEYWDTPGGLIATVIGFAKGLVGQDPDTGENEKLQLSN